MGKSGLQREMDSFLRETEDAAFNIRRVTKSAFSQARKNLSADAFLELNDVIVKDFYQNESFLGYKKSPVAGSGWQLSESTGSPEHKGGIWQACLWQRNKKGCTQKHGAAIAAL